MNDSQSVRVRHDFLVDAVHVFFLSGLALAQPLFDVLSRGAEFFVARQSRPAELVIFAILASFLVPAFIVALEYIFGLLGKPYRKILHYSFVAIAASIIFLPPMKRLESVPETTLLIAAGVSGSVVVWIYVRLQPMRSRFALVLLAIAAVVPPGFFLFGTRVSKLVIRENPIASRGVALNTSTPVVLVVFDELSTTALLDESSTIDPVRYPHLADLARHSTWFRNATTVADFTTMAVPAILTGKYPAAHELLLPTAEDHPDNMFELFSRSHKTVVYESRTSINRVSSSRHEAYDLLPRLSALVSDTTLVYLHIISTPGLSRRLPPVTQDWGDFRPADMTGNLDESINDTPDTPGEPKTDGERFQEWFTGLVKARPFNQPQDRDQQFQAFLISLETSEDASFHFIHSLFPHIPYDHLPSGKVFTTDRHIDGLVSERWIEDGGPVRRAQKRHLLQVRFVDKLIGDLVARLKEVDLYDRSLVIVTSDHGVSFRPGDSRRKMTGTNYCDIMKIPLLIKAPYQSKGVIEEGNVETVDILPTVADILDVTVPWKMDGHSAISDDVPARSEKTVYSGQVADKKLFSFSSSLMESCSNLERQVNVFGSGGDDTLAVEPYLALIGRQVSEFESASVKAGNVEVNDGALYQNVRPDSMYIPALIVGKLTSAGRPVPKAPLAVSVNGTIRSVVETDVHSGARHFSALVPETSFVKGRNLLAFHAVSRVGEAVSLSRFQSGSEVTFSLVRKGPGSDEAIISSAGDTVSLLPGALIGHLDRAEIDGDFVQISGWAADLSRSRLPASILVFVDGEMRYQGPTNRERPDVVKAHEDEAIRGAGFRYTLPLEYLGDPTHSEMRIFALSDDGVASEVLYSKGYSWGSRPALDAPGDKE